jgi:hypothetical protein
MRADLRRQLTGRRGRIADESEARFLRGQDVSIEPETTAPLDLAQQIGIEKREALAPSGCENDHIRLQCFGGIKRERICADEPCNASASEG